jgi:hypothetical protein
LPQAHDHSFQSLTQAAIQEAAALRLYFQNSEYFLQTEDDLKMAVDCFVRAKLSSLKNLFVVEDGYDIQQQQQADELIQLLQQAAKCTINWNHH